MTYVIDPTVPLPAGLTASQIRKCIDSIERKSSELADLYFEQANLFSAVVGLMATRALDASTNYERNPHAHLSQQRFPDLCRRGAGSKLAPQDCLECKASKRAWEVQSHYNHSGWYIIWRYLVDDTETIEAGKPVIIWRVDVVFLDKADWKYERSTAGDGGGGRTHTFGVQKPAKKLAGKAVIARSDIKLLAGKPVPKNGH